MINPEFTRNRWLELTRHRLIGTPVILGAIFTLVYILPSADRQDNVAYTAAFLYIALLLVYGIRQASDAVFTEIKNHTWDTQRMTAISPWSMSWGKLFGATIFPWYAGGICLAVYAVLSYQNPLVIKHILLAILTGILANGFAMFVGLATIQKNRQQTRSTFAVVIFLVLFFIAPSVSALHELDFAAIWYGFQLAKIDLWLVNIGVFCFWVLLGIFRLMQKELQEKTTPAAWVSFCIFLPLWFGGYIHSFPGEEIFSYRILLGCSILFPAVYFTLFAENIDPISLRRLQINIRSRNWRLFFESLPAWLVTILMSFLSLLLFVGVDLKFSTQVLGDTGMLKMFAVACFLFILRDTLIFLYFNFSLKKTRTDITVLLYLMILYLLIPGILFALEFEAIGQCFLPMPHSGALISAIAVSVQVILLSFLVYKRWRNITELADNHDFGL